MKKFLIVLFILVQGLIFAAGKNLADIKTLKFDVVEKTIIKSKKRELTYKIDFILPNKIKKEVIAPKLNKGEIYMYDYSANKKSVYLPMFNETKESEIVDDENRIIKAINKIIEEEKTNKNFKQKYNAKKAQNLNIDKQIRKGIIISKKDVEEADRYIDIFMEDYGKVSTLIKGIRKSKKRDKTAVDILSLTDFQFYKKNDSLIISNFSTVKDYLAIKSDIDKINMAFYIFSILNQILVENGRNRKLYEVLEKTLDYLNSSDDVRKNYLLLLYFLYTVIKEEGISIEGDIDELQFEIPEQKKIDLDKTSRKILEYLFEDKLKIVINDENFELNSVKKAILVLENYINFNLDTNINAKKMLWGALLW